MQETHGKQVDPWVRKTPWSRKWQPTLVFFPGKFQRRRNLASTVNGVIKSQTQLSTHTSRHQWTRMSQSSVIATLQCELVNPKGTQEGEYLRASSLGTTATPYGEPWGNSECENTGYWLQIAEVPIKGMISLSPDSFIFPCTEKCWFFLKGGTLSFMKGGIFPYP